MCDPGGRCHGGDKPTYHYGLRTIGALEPYAETIQSGEKRDELRITAWADKKSGGMRPVKQYDGISAGDWLMLCSRQRELVIEITNTRTSYLNPGAAFDVHDLCTRQSWRHVNATDENGNRYVSVWRRMTELIPAEPPEENTADAPLDNQSGGESPTNTGDDGPRIEDIRRQMRGPEWDEPKMIEIRALEEMGAMQKLAADDPLIKHIVDAGRAVDTMWTGRVKRNADRSISKYKGRCVLRDLSDGAPLSVCRARAGLPTSDPTPRNHLQQTRRGRGETICPRRRQLEIDALNDGFLHLPGQRSDSTQVPAPRVHRHVVV